MIRPALPLVPLVLLVACGTPQEQCIRNATYQTRTLDRLIAQSSANLARGYEYQTEQRTRFEWVVCGPIRPDEGPQMCFEPSEEDVRVPVAIDPVLEQRKLANLTAKRAGLLKQSESVVAACRVTYPE